MNVLTISDLSIDFPSAGGVVHAVANLSLSIAAGRRVGFIGESGSGKTTTALSVMRMLAGTGRVADGTIRLGETDVLALSDEEMRKTRLSRVSYIPQGAMNSLNPIMRIEDQIWDAITAHEGRTDGTTLKKRSDDVLASVGLGSHVGRLYPHELSGGMKQRVCIARALAAKPKLIICDEVTSALDPLVADGILKLLLRLQKIEDVAYLFITHDLDEAVRIGDRIAIMRDGKMVQMGTAEDIVMNPADDYVADFVAGISRLKVVHASAVMQPIAEFTTTHGPLPADAPRVGEAETLSTLINLAIDDTNPILVQEGGLDVGVITRADLLRTVVEGTEMS